MVATAVEVQKNFSKYIDTASSQEVVITRDGHPVARLLGMSANATPTKSHNTPISDSLLGLLKGTDITCVNDIKNMRMGI